jgi:hypothetical protein
MSKPTVRHCLPGLLGAVLALYLVPALVEAQTAPVLDHFKCYRTTGQPPDVTVLLHDQFDPAGVPPDPTFVRWPVKFCLPVAKTTPDGAMTPITDENAHLEMFITAPGRLEPTRRVVVKNQFGTQRLLTYGPELLAVPSAKNTQPPSDNLDHFKCYRTYGRPKNIVLKLADQFQDGVNATLLRPIEFCNPVEKTHGDFTIPIKNPTAHLLCYTITPTTFQGDALVRNQFGGGPMPMATADMLCVPSQKLRFSIVTP